MPPGWRRKPRKPQNNSTLWRTYSGPHLFCKCLDYRYFYMVNTCNTATIYSWRIRISIGYSRRYSYCCMQIRLHESGYASGINYLNHLCVFVWLFVCLFIGVLFVHVFSFVCYSVPVRFTPDWVTIKIHYQNSCCTTPQKSHTLSW